MSPSPSPPSRAKIDDQSSTGWGSGPHERSPRVPSPIPFLIREEDSSTGLRWQTSDDRNPPTNPGLETENPNVLFAGRGRQRHARRALGVRRHTATRAPVEMLFAEPQFVKQNTVYVFARHAMIALGESLRAVTTDLEALGVFAYEKRDWLPGDIIQQGSASLRMVDVIPLSREARARGRNAQVDPLKGSRRLVPLKLFAAGSRLGWPGTGSARSATIGWPKSSITPSATTKQPAPGNAIQSDPMRASI